MGRYNFSANNPDGLREELKNWVREKYADVLGDKIRLLDHPEGWDLLDKLVKERLFRLKHR